MTYPLGFDPMTFDEAPFISVQYNVSVDGNTFYFDDAHCTYDEAFESALTFARLKKAEGHFVVLSAEPFDDVYDIDTGKLIQPIEYEETWEEQDRRKDYLENYAAEEMGFERIETDELPL